VAVGIYDFDSEIVKIECLALYYYFVKIIGVRWDSGPAKPEIKQFTFSFRKFHHDDKSINKFEIRQPPSGGFFAKKLKRILMKISIPHDSVFYKIISFIGQGIIVIMETVLGFFAKEKIAVISPDQISWTAQIEQHTDEILAELRSVMQHYDSIPNLSDLSAEQKRIVIGERNWKTFLFYTYGASVRKNISLCPRTDAAIRSIPGMTTAFFSIMEPHTSLAPHRGPYKGVLRYHLGLIIPQPPNLCGIRVDGAVYHWAVGRSLIFDDTYTHEVWNNSDEPRVVLFVDFKRNFIFPINVFNNFMIALIRWSPFVSNVLKKLEHIDRSV
jgi:ornithine lipid ester-linked acyl 2-hydroxylase